MELSIPRTKEFLVFSQKKAFIMFQEIEIFKKTSCISGGFFRKFSELKKLKNPAMKKFLIFR